eukprot:6301930-Lingulodinium_polyedra.AAC.1
MSNFLDECKKLVMAHTETLNQAATQRFQQGLTHTDAVFLPADVSNLEVPKADVETLMWNLIDVMSASAVAEHWNKKELFAAQWASRLHFARAAFVQHELAVKNIAESSGIEQCAALIQEAVNGHASGAK